MKLSIRNRFDATVESVAIGPAMTAIHARLTGGQLITAAITGEAAVDLQLQPHSAVQVLIKSTEVSVSVDPVGRVSVRNVLPGTVVAVDHGEIMSTLKVGLPGGDVLTAVITKESAQELALDVGVAVTALVKSTDVAIGVA